jgi:ABC-type multidrug transport system ATPase subunit
VIHQPRSSIFNMFDQLMLLSDGNIIYNGIAFDAIEYFSRLGLQCDEFYNPLDFFLDILSYDNRSEELENNSDKRILYLANNWINENEKHEKNGKFLSKFDTNDRDLKGYFCF